MKRHYIITESTPKGLIQYVCDVQTGEKYIIAGDLENLFDVLLDEENIFHYFKDLEKDLRDAREDAKEELRHFYSRHLHADDFPF